MDVQIGPEKTFGFIDNKTAMARDKIPGIKLVPNYNTVNMSAKDFFQKINDPELGTTIFFFSNSDVC